MKKKTHQYFVLLTKFLHKLEFINLQMKIQKKSLSSVQKMKAFVFLTLEKEEELRVFLPKRIFLALGEKQQRPPERSTGFTSDEYCRNCGRSSDDNSG